MKSKFLFVFTVVSFFNPIAVMAGGLGESRTVTPQNVLCMQWAEKKLQEQRVANNSDAKTGDSKGLVSDGAR